MEIITKRRTAEKENRQATREAHERAAIQIEAEKRAGTYCAPCDVREKTARMIKEKTERLVK